MSILFPPQNSILFLIVKQIKHLHRKQYSNRMSEQSVHSSACQSVFLLLFQGEGSGRGQVGEEGELGGRQLWQRKVGNNN